MRRLIKLSNGSGNVFDLGQQKGKHDYCSLRLGLLGYLWMDSKTYRGRTGRGGLRLRNLEILVGCRGVIRVLIGWIYHRIRILRVWRVNCCLRSSMFFSVFFVCFMEIDCLVFSLGKRKVLDRSDGFLSFYILFFFLFYSFSPRFTWTLNVTYAFF